MHMSILNDEHTPSITNDVERSKLSANSRHVHDIKFIYQLSYMFFSNKYGDYVRCWVVFLSFIFFSLSAQIFYDTGCYIEWWKYIENSF